MMAKILLLGSIHKDDGQCSSQVLSKILEEIRPDVIFMEVPPKQFTALFNNQLQDSLESSAVKKFLTGNDVKIIPVDLDDLPNRDKFRKMNNTFNRDSEYNRVLTDYRYCGRRYGFKFLNSKEADQMLDYLQFIESEIVRNAKVKEFTSSFQEWNAIMDKRENHWIDSIHKFYEKDEFKVAVFIVGSAHRIRLMDKLLRINKKENQILDWNFYPFE